MSARFVVESPFQLLMATEAADHFALEPAARELVVLWPGEERNIAQIRRLLEVGHWPIVREAPRRARSTHVARSRVVRRIATGDGADDLFIGDHESPLMRHLANAGRHRRLHVLDDGLRTVTVARLRSTGSAPDGRGRGERVARRLTATALGLDTGLPGPLDYFTFFAIEPSGQDTVTPNPLTRLRRRATRNPADPSRALFLGAPEVEVGGMREDDYRRVMAAVLEALGGEVLYAPHRREAPAKLERLERDLGLRVIPAPGPIEWEVGDLDPAPGVVASFFSTALLTLPRVLADAVAVQAFRMPEDLVVPERRAVIAGAHQALVAQSRGRIAERAITLH